MKADLVIVVLIVVGLLGRSPIIATAASFLLILKLLHLERLFGSIERRGLELGLLFLTIAVLVPFVSGKITWQQIIAVFNSPAGILACIGGALATYMNGKGLDLLRIDPQLIVGLVIGSIFGIIFLRGIPVGPLMAAGITAFFMSILRMWWN